MEIALVCYFLYASIILIWCSLSGDWVDYFVISPDQLEQWSATRSDLIVFEMRPDCKGQPSIFPEGGLLAATPSSLKRLVDWIPPDSTLVFCNRGISSRSVQNVQQFLMLHRLSRIYWLDESAHGVVAGRSGW